LLLKRENFVDIEFDPDEIKHQVVIICPTPNTENKNCHEIVKCDWKLLVTPLPSEDVDVFLNYKPEYTSGGSQIYNKQQKNDLGQSMLRFSELRRDDAMRKYCKCERSGSFHTS